MMLNALRRLIERAGRAAAAGLAGGPVWDGGPGAAVLLVGRDGRIEAACAAAPGMFSLSRGLLIGASLAALVKDEDRAGVERALRLGGALGRTEARLAGMKTRAVAFAMRERPDGKRAVLVTECAEGAGADDMRRLSAEAGAARRAADAARRDAKARADLLADLSHEMRTPLNAVIGFAEAMNEETFGPLGHQKYREYARHIRASGGHLLDLISSILDLAKIEADRFVLKRALVDAGALAAECAGIVRLSAEKAGLALTVAVADDLPECALDARATRQILLNLLSNAVKFTSDGEIALGVKAHGTDIVFTVTDTGVGMSAAELKKLGARFTSAHGPGVRGAKGAGLGLALAFALAELHGGSMKLESAPGEGVRATVRLPITAPASPNLRAPAARAGNPFARRAAPDESAPAAPAVLTQLERIEAYRRERRMSAA